MGATRFLTRAIPAAAGQTLRALKHPNYRLFFFGQLVSLVGSWMQSLAQSWLLWRLTHSASLLGLLGFAQSIPVLFVGPFGGEAADRFDRRKLAIATQTAALVQATVLAALTLGGWIQVWQIVALAALLGIVNAVDMPVRQAFLVQMVGREDLSNAIALNSSIFNGARMVGPALAGIIASRWGEGPCFALNAASFVAVLASLLAMRIEKRPAAPASAGTWRRIEEGFAYAWRTPHVRGLLALLLVTGLFGIPYSTLMPAVAGGILGRDASGLGVLMSSAGAGALAGALAMAHRRGIRGLGRWTAYMAMGFGASLVLFGMSRSFPLSCAALAMLGFCMMSQMASINTLLQSLVPEELRGRLMSLYVTLFMGTAPIGSLAQGRLASVLGVQTILAASGVTLCLAGIASRLVIPKMRQSILPLLPPEPGADGLG